MENIFRQTFLLSGLFWGWIKLSIWNSRHFPRESEGEIQGRKKKGIFSEKGIVWLYNYLYLNEISIESVFPFFFWLPLSWDTCFGKTETHFIIICGGSGGDGGYRCLRKVSIWLGIYNYLGLGERKRKECLLCFYRATDHFCGHEYVWNRRGGRLDFGEESCPP